MMGVLEWHKKNAERCKLLDLVTRGIVVTHCERLFLRASQRDQFLAFENGSQGNNWGKVITCKLITARKIRHSRKELDTSIVICQYENILSRNQTNR